MSEMKTLRKEKWINFEDVRTLRVLSLDWRPWSDENGNAG
jgi:hypothetical protein